MARRKIKAIIIHGKVWFDRSAGNSYFSARATVHYANPKFLPRVLALPMEYGYGDHYKDRACDELLNAGLVPGPIANSSDRARWIPGALFEYHKDEGCTKREMVAFGRDE